MIPGPERGATTATEVSKRYSDAWGRIKNIFPWVVEDEQYNWMGAKLELQNGYLVKARYLPDTWMEIEIIKEKKGVLSFVMRETGLESIGLRNPSLALGNGEVKLSSFGIGPKGGLMALDYLIEQSENMDNLGAKLVEWLEDSVGAGSLRPLDLSVKFPLLPRE